MEHLSIWCDGCEQQGEIFVENLDQVFIVCENCRHETSQVWCPKCGVGGEFVKDIGQRPAEWICPACKSNYQLTDSFYLNPVPLKILGTAERATAPQGVNLPSSSRRIWLFTASTWLIILLVGLWTLPQKLDASFILIWGIAVVISFGVLSIKNK